MVPDRRADEPEIIFDLGTWHIHLPSDHTLCWGITAAGDLWPFIVDDRLTGRSPVPWGPGLERLAPHEQLGPLPASVQRRVEVLTAHRCGAPTSKKRPCRLEVAEPGQRCQLHGDVEP